MRPQSVRIEKPRAGSAKAALPGVRDKCGPFRCGWRTPTALPQYAWGTSRALRYQRIKSVTRGPLRSLFFVDWFSSEEPVGNWSWTWSDSGRRLRLEQEASVKARCDREALVSRATARVKHAAEDSSGTLFGLLRMGGFAGQLGDRGRMVVVPSAKAASSRYTSGRQGGADSAEKYQDLRQRLALRETLPKSYSGSFTTGGFDRRFTPLLTPLCPGPN